MKHYEFNYKDRLCWSRTLSNAIVEFRLYVIRWYGAVPFDVGDPIDRSNYNIVWREPIVKSKVANALFKANTNIREL